MKFTLQTATPHAMRNRLNDYMTANVLTADHFACRFASACKTSHLGAFHEGQLHHVGRYFDLLSDGRPFRVMVCGQEYGHPPARVGLDARSKMVVQSSGHGSRFRAEGGYPARNPHMRGTTSILRLLFGLGLGSAYQDEFITVGAETVHIFDAFALVNFLLCSATDGTKRGRSTRTMQSNCTGHFRNTVEILKPTFIVCQGKGVRKWMSMAFEFQRVGPELEILNLQQDRSIVLTLAHPSAHFPMNWGANDRTPYLVEKVQPLVQEALALYKDGGTRSS